VLAQQFHYYRFISDSVVEIAGYFNEKKELLSVASTQLKLSLALYGRKEVKIYKKKEKKEK
jgi:hypothetical protein